MASGALSRALSKHRHLLAVLVVVVVVYHRVVFAGFVNWDDTRFIIKNPVFHGRVLEYIWRCVSEVQFEAYQPVHLLSYVPDRLLWPDSAAGFHVVELALFITDLVLLYALARRRSGAAAAACATLVFALHPLVVEPVAWITARKDLLALLFVVLAIGREDRDAPRRWVSWVWFLLALGSKSAAVCFPPILWLWLICMGGVPWRTATRRVLPYVVPAIACGVAAIVIFHAHDMVAPTELLHPLDIPGSLGLYLQHVLAPYDLAPLYSEHPASWLAYAVLAVFIACIVLRARIPRPARFALLAFVCALLPASNVIPILRYGDRFALLGLAFLVPPLAIALDKRRWLCGAALVVAVVEAALTIPQINSWDHSLALWANAARHQPDTFYVRLKYGETLRDAGELNAAIDQYHAALAVDPNNKLALASLLNVYAERAEHDGELSAGTHEKWMSQLVAALTEPKQFAQLWGQVASTRCLACKDTLLVLGLLLWPQPDQALLADAEDALGRGVPDEALIFLGNVRTRDERYAVLLARAGAAGIRRHP
jgi:hypothetical protein